MQSMISRVSTNNQKFLNPLQIIEIHDTDMLFPTKLTPLINTRGLIDSASLKNHHNNKHDSGSHKWPKTFLGGVCYVRKLHTEIIFKICIYDTIEIIVH